MDALIAITYRCNARCHMCSIWKHPSKPEDEIKPVDLMHLPKGLRFINITGGEPFIREDIEDFINILQKKTDRIVISTNGFFTEKIINLCKKHKNLGIRISLEGFSEVNDKLRGIKGGFEKGLKTLVELNSIGHKDIGFGITLSDENIGDLIPLLNLSESMKMEFATAVVHNTFYFHKFDNKIHKIHEMVSALEELINKLIKTNRPKNWFRAYFNHGLINFIRNGERLLPCMAGTILFYVDPYGEVYPCNGMNTSLGNIKSDSWEKIWKSSHTEEIREKVRKCEKNCWMIGSVAPMIKKHIFSTSKWVIKQKGKSILGKSYSVHK